MVVYLMWAASVMLTDFVMYCHRLGSKEGTECMCYLCGYLQPISNEPDIDYFQDFNVLTWLTALAQRPRWLLASDESLYSSLSILCLNIQLSSTLSTNITNFAGRIMLLYAVYYIADLQGTLAVLKWACTAGAVNVAAVNLNQHLQKLRYGDPICLWAPSTHFDTFYFANDIFIRTSKLTSDKDEEWLGTQIS
jgi:hypothetical protein